MVQLLRMDGTDIETYEKTYEMCLVILVGNGWVAGGCWDENLDS